MYKKCEELLKKLELEEKINVLWDFKFPPKQELKLRLKDMLEDEVDEKYYLSDEQVEKIKASTFQTNARRIQGKDWCDTLCARDWKDPKCIQVGELDIKGHDCIKRVYSDDGLSPTLTDMQGGNRQPKIIIDDTQGFDDVRVYDKYSPALRASRLGLKTIDYDTKVAVAMRGRYNENGETEQPKIIDTNFSRKREYAEYSPTIDTYANKLKVQGNRIRKLTPKECWRLMGFDDEDFEKAAQVNSNTQLYKQAGNSIVVNVLEKIFENLLNN